MPRPAITDPRWFGLVTLALLVIALYLNLGLVPLRLEEPRRALIALEMIFSGDYLAPTEFGEPYLNKPPLWNWVIVAAFSLFDGYSEFAVRFFSVTSLLTTGALMYLLGRRYLDEEEAIVSALLFLVSGHLLFYFSLLGEIDLFFAFITFAALGALFHFYQQGNYWWAFSLFYGLNGLGTLTKGFPSLAFAAVSVLALLAYRRDLKRLFSAAHVVGALVFLGIVGAYLFAYSLEHSLPDYLLSLWHQASGRTLVATDSPDSLASHLLSFPLDTFKAVLPATLLLPFVLRRRLLQVVRENPLIEYYAWLGLANFAVYWISPGAKQRYIYMLYPLLVAILVWCYRRLSADGGWRSRLFRGVVWLFLVLAAAVPAALPFVGKFDSVPQVLPVSLLAATAGGGLLVLLYRRPALRLWSLIWAAIVLRLVMDLVILPHKAATGKDAKMRETAEQIARLSEDTPVYLYRGTTCSRTIVYYLARSTSRIVRRADQPLGQRLYIAEAGRLGGTPHELLYRFTDDEGGDYRLVRFRP
jgi:4-amino-4-deoxy-L-arabinose transferase-like glycosyltransferase